MNYKLTFVAILFCFVSLKAQSPGNKSVQVLFSVPGPGETVNTISNYRYVSFNENENYLTVTGAQKEKIKFELNKIWGYWIKNAYGSQLYRPRRTKGFCATYQVMQIEDSMVIYKQEYEKHPGYCFSKGLADSLYFLNYSWLEQVYKSNPYFLAMVKEEMDNKTGYAQKDYKTDKFLICNLYKESLKNPYWDGKTENIKTKYRLKKIKKNGIYWIMSLSGSQYFQHNNIDTLITRFNYSSNDTVTNKTSNKTFSDTAYQPLSLKPLIIDFNLAYNYYNNCFNLKLGGDVNTHKSFHFDFSYARAFDLNLDKKGKHQISLQPGMGIAYNRYSQFIGSIDNVNQKVSALGETFNPRFVIVTHSKYSGTHYYYYQSQKIDLYHQIQCWSLSPQITLANNRNNRIYYSLTAGWNLVFYDHSGLGMEQKSGSVIGSHKEEAFNNKEIYSNKSGSGIFKAPFKFGGPFIGLSVGFYLNK